MVKPSRAGYKLNHKGKVHSTYDYKETSLYKSKKRSLSYEEAKQEIKGLTR